VTLCKLRLNIRKAKVMIIDYVFKQNIYHEMQKPLYSGQLHFLENSKCVEFVICLVVTFVVIFHC